MHRIRNNDFSQDAKLKLEEAVIDRNSLSGYAKLTIKI